MRVGYAWTPAPFTRASVAQFDCVPAPCATEFDQRSPADRRELWLRRCCVHSGGAHPVGSIASRTPLEIEPEPETESERKLEPELELDLNLDL